MGRRNTFLAMIVCVGTCSTFFTLPPLPCPSSFKSLRSSSRRSYLTTALMSRLASLFESVVWYVMRFALADITALGGADEDPNETATIPSPAGPPPSLAEGSAGVLGLRFIGGGRFFAPPAAGLLAGAGRVEMGSGSGADMGWAETSSWSALKLRFERMRLIGRFFIVPKPEASRHKKK